MSVSFNKTGVVDASGETDIVDKAGLQLSNFYNYSHGFVEDNSTNKQMSTHDNYILASEFIEY